MSDATTTKRFEVFYSGRVQGVGFRYTTRRIAGRYQVTGFVRNLVDGRVQLVAEGTANELAGFLNEIDETMRDNIQESHRSDSAGTGEFEKFKITH